jgi:hypothetical protein
MQSVTTWKKGSEPTKQRKHMEINIWRILHTWRWPCRPKHVVKDSGNQRKAGCRRRHNLQYPYASTIIPLYRTTTTTVQMAQPVLEIMAILSYRLKGGLIFFILLAIRIKYILWANLQAKTLPSCAYYVKMRSSPVRGPLQPSIRSTGQNFLTFFCVVALVGAMR